MPLQWVIVFFAWGGAVLLAAIPNLRQATLANVAVSAGRDGFSATFWR